MRGGVDCSVAERDSVAVVRALAEVEAGATGGVALAPDEARPEDGLLDEVGAGEETSDMAASVG